MRRFLILLFFALTFFQSGRPANPQLTSGTFRISWRETPQGWITDRFETVDGARPIPWGQADGSYTLLYSAEKPSDKAETILNRGGDTLRFDIERFRFIYPTYCKATSSVPLNRAGEAIRMYPHHCAQQGDTVCFTAKHDAGIWEAFWWADLRNPGDICVKQRFTASRSGYYSLSSPSMAVLAEEDLAWGQIPGFFQGDRIEPDFHLSYMYAQGLPHLPVICNENTITTMTSLMSDKSGATLAVTPEPGYDRKPYQSAGHTHARIWKTGLSHMTCRGELSPTAYHPILGQEGSWLESGERIEFEVRYTLRRSDWYAVYRHVIYDIYGFREELARRHSTVSLSDRMLAIHRYVLDDSLSLWQTRACGDVTVGAQAYLGGVAGEEADAMKNSDIGAVWMLASMTDDEKLKKHRLPYIRNFKLKQQEESGPYTGAAKGQYFLWKRQKFVEEWGAHMEPIGITYYTLCDLGNILLFEPQDSLLREKFRQGARCLLSLQKPDGSFDVAFDKHDGQPLFTDLQDLRPTFYGFIVAYRILGEQEYLDAAIRGADWYIKHAVDRGRFIGVCGDVRFINDFTTAQGAQALLDMAELTGDEKYRQAAIRTARLYTASIYTHARSSEAPVTYKGQPYKEWQFSQVGLNFEHGGSTGSAAKSGPILLTSHCGLFVRMAQTARDSLFLDMARTAALGRDAFLNPQTRIATYYWTQFDRGPGPFPQHAWWQLGWIVDYLLSEAEMRSAGRIVFPRGFMTPKVGPQRITGFQPGRIDGEEARLILRPGTVEIDNGDIDCLTALSEDGQTLYVILLGSSASHNTGQVKLNLKTLGWEKAVVSGPKEGLITPECDFTCSIEGFGIEIWKFKRQPE